MYNADDYVKTAMAELNELLKNNFHADVKTDWLDKENQEMDLG